jgi:hypothetical protein
MVGVRLSTRQRLPPRRHSRKHHPAKNKAGVCPVLPLRQGRATVPADKIVVVVTTHQAADHSVAWRCMYASLSHWQDENLNGFHLM